MTTAAAVAVAAIAAAVVGRMPWAAKMAVVVVRGRGGVRPAGATATAVVVVRL